MRLVRLAVILLALVPTPSLAELAPSGIDIGFDGGLGISPHNLGGPFFVLHTGPKMGWEVGTALAGARTKVLGSPLALGVVLRLSRRTKLHMGTTTFQGQGLKQVAFPGTCGDIPDGADTSCGGYESGHQVSAMRQTRWLVSYFNMGVRRLWRARLSADHLQIFAEVGGSYAFLGKIDVEQPKDSPELGAPDGIVIDSNYWTGHAKVKRGDIGPYGRVGIVLSI